MKFALKTFAIVGFAAVGFIIGFALVFHVLFLVFVLPRGGLI